MNVSNIYDTPACFNNPFVQYIYNIDIFRLGIVCGQDHPYNIFYLGKTAACPTGVPSQMGCVWYQKNRYDKYII